MILALASLVNEEAVIKLGIVLGHLILLVNADFGISPDLFNGEAPIVVHEVMRAWSGLVASSGIMRMCIHPHLVAWPSKVARKTSIHGACSWRHCLGVPQFQLKRV